MKLNTLNTSNFAKRLKSQAISLGIAASLVSGLGSCEWTKHKYEDKQSTTNTEIHIEPTTYADLSEEELDAQEKETMLPVIERQYQDLIAHRGKTCYIIKRNGEDLWGESPSDRLFLSKEDIDDTYTTTEKENWKIIPTPLTDDMIYDELLDHSGLGWENRDFWDAKIKEFEKEYGKNLKHLQ